MSFASVSHQTSPLRHQMVVHGVPGVDTPPCLLSAPDCPLASSNPPTVANSVSINESLSLNQLALCTSHESTLIAGKSHPTDVCDKNETVISPPHTIANPVLPNKHSPLMKTAKVQHHAPTKQQMKSDIRFEQSLPSSKLISMLRGARMPVMQNDMEFNSQPVNTNDPLKGIVGCYSIQEKAERNTQAEPNATHLSRSSLPTKESFPLRSSISSIPHPVASNALKMSLLKRYAIPPSAKLPTASEPQAAPPPDDGTARIWSIISTHRMHPLFSQSYTTKDLIGEGGFGFVMSAVHHASSMLVAAKFIFKGSPYSYPSKQFSDKIPISSYVIDSETRTSIPSELAILRHVRHPNIIGYLEDFEDSRFYYLITKMHGQEWSNSSWEAANKTADPLTQISVAKSIARRASMDLFECIDVNRKFDEATSRLIFRQVVDAVLYLHSMGICHRDIKDENVVIDEWHAVKLIDFGAASALNPNGKRFKTFHGTLRYCPPEVLRGFAYGGFESDVWGLGILLFTILFGRNPFSSTKSIIQYSSIADIFDVNAGISATCWSFIEGMMEVDPVKRSKIQDISMHPWLSNVTS